LFAVTLVGQVFTGWKEHNSDLQQSGGHARDARSDHKYIIGFGSVEGVLAGCDYRIFLPETLVTTVTGILIGFHLKRIFCVNHQLKSYQGEMLFHGLRYRIAAP